MHCLDSALMTVSDDDDVCALLFPQTSHISTCVCVYFMCGSQTCRDTGMCMNTCVYVFVCVCGILRIWRANISVHIAVKGYVGANTPTGKEGAVLLATF